MTMQAKKHKSTKPEQSAQPKKRTYDLHHFLDPPHPLKSSDANLKHRSQRVSVHSPNCAEDRLDMATAAPVAIGTRGTVGSLVRKEIEYFSKVHSSSSPAEEAASRRGHFRLGFRFFAAPWRRKKRLVPRICSVVEVAERNYGVRSEIPGFNYRVLKDEY